MRRRWRWTGWLREYVGECAGSRSVGRPRKRWIDSVKECLRKRGLDIRQARRMLQDRSEWMAGVCKAWKSVCGENLSFACFIVAHFMAWCVPSPRWRRRYCVIK